MACSRSGCVSFRNFIFTTSPANCGGFSPGNDPRIGRGCTGSGARRSPEVIASVIGGFVSGPAIKKGPAAFGQDAQVAGPAGCRVFARSLAVPGRMKKRRGMVVTDWRTDYDGQG